MGNRKERRATKKIRDADSIPLAQPDRSIPSARTLFDLAAEHQSQLGDASFSRSNGADGPQPKLVSKIFNPDGTIGEEESLTSAGIDDAPIGPLGDAVFYTLGLTALHMTLDVLVHHQYAEVIDWGLVGQQTLKSFAMLLVLVYGLHSRADEVWAQGLFLGACMGAGCYLTYISSEEPMLAVMRKAPSIGTLWVWTVLELRVEFAVIGLAVIAGYFWKQGYSF